MDEEIVAIENTAKNLYKKLEAYREVLDRLALINPNDDSIPIEMQMKFYGNPVSNEKLQSYEKEILRLYYEKQEFFDYIGLDEMIVKDAVSRNYFGTGATKYDNLQDITNDLIKADRERIKNYFLSRSKVQDSPKEQILKDPNDTPNIILQKGFINSSLNIVDKSSGLKSISHTGESTKINLFITIIGGVIVGVILLLIAKYHIWGL